MKDTFKAIIIIFFVSSLLACQTKVDINNVKSKLVKVYTIEEVTTSEERSFAGTVIEGKKANLSFRISAPIERIYVEEGEYVEQGQLLAKLDARDYQLQYTAVQAQFEQISSEVARIETLYKKGNVAINDYEKAQAGLKQITAKYESVQNSLNDIKLLAPYSGFIQDIYFQQSEIIKAGLPVISLISNKDFQIQCDIPAIVYANKDKFSSYSVTLETNPEEEIPLQLDNIKHKANLNSLYRVFFNIQNQSSKSPKMAVGMDCQVKIVYELETSDQENIVKVPMESIVQSERYSSFVWLLNTHDRYGYIVNKRPVKIIGIDESGLVMISDGLKAGDRIIKAGVHSLAENQQVEPLKENSPLRHGGSK